MLTSLYPGGTLDFLAKDYESFYNNRDQQFTWSATSARKKTHKTSTEISLWKSGICFKMYNMFLCHFDLKE